MSHANDLDAPLGGLRAQRLGVRIIQYGIATLQRAERCARMSREKGTRGDRMRLGHGRDRIIRVRRFGIAWIVGDNGHIVSGRRGIDDFLCSETMENTSKK